MGLYSGNEDAVHMGWWFMDAITMPQLAVGKVENTSRPIATTPQQSTTSNRNLKCGHDVMAANL
jgi:hypothetical protein